MRLGRTVDIPYAYADLRFKPAFDKKTGLFTRSVLCIPIVNQVGKAIGAFEAALALHPDDLLSQIYVQRCNALKTRPPSTDWDGVWVMDEK